MFSIRNKTKEQLIATAALLIVVAASAGCRQITERLRGENTNSATIDSQKTKPQSTPPIALLPFGNPSSASGDDKDNFLLVHDAQVISYNDSRGTMNWTAWRTTRSDLGKRLERPLFEPDPDLPADFRKIGYYDYSGGGYDRGHMLPSADRFGNAGLNSQTFYMSNIVPQTGELNQFPWEKLESYSRSLVYRGNETYTIAGLYGEKGRLKNKVTVPTHCWKVIVVFRRGEKTNAINGKTRIIAVDMPNNEGIENMPWENYKTTIRAIEEKTGLDLFNSLPKELQDQIEMRIDKN